MKSIFLTTSALVLGFALQAQAQSTDFVSAVVAQLESEGYSEIEVSREGAEIVISAERDGTELETVYDAATGAILSQETEIEDEVGEDDEEDDAEQDDDDEDDDDDDEGDDDEDDDDDDDEENDDD